MMQEYPGVSFLSTLKKISVSKCCGQLAFRRCYLRCAGQMSGRVERCHLEAQNENQVQEETSNQEYGANGPGEHVGQLMASDDWILDSPVLEQVCRLPTSAKAFDMSPHPSRILQSSVVWSWSRYYLRTIIASNPLLETNHSA